MIVSAAMFVAFNISKADLTDYDAAIAADDIALPGGSLVKRATSASLDGSNGVPFDFGNTFKDKTIEFIVAGDPAQSGEAVLAVGANSTFELRFEQWKGTGRLGFTHLGTKDYVSSIPFPIAPTHVTFRWDEISNTADVMNMEIYINGELCQTINAPGFKMPGGQGFLGARDASGRAGMVGRIDRVTAYTGALDPVLIRRHARAFLARPYRTVHDPVDICYEFIFESSESHNPLDQGWTGSEVTLPATSHFPATGLINTSRGRNVGRRSFAWQIYDYLEDAAFDAPRYHHPITPEQLDAFYDNGWTMEATVKAVGVDHATSSFVGWQFGRAHDPGYGVGTNGARVGFHFREDANGAFIVTTTFGSPVNLGPGSGENPHTIRAVGLPRSPGFEWFVDDVSQGFLDMRDFPFGSNESIFFGANSSASKGDASDWYKVSLRSESNIDIPKSTWDVAREVRSHDDSMVGNGVDTATGAFMRAHQLLSVQGVRTVDFPIYHDSRLTARPGPLGYGWSHAFEARLQSFKGGRVVVHWDANRLSEFAYAETIGSQRYFKGVDEDVQYAELVENAFGSSLTFPSGTWRLTLLDGSVYGFNPLDGRLIYVANSARQGMDLEYDAAGRLVAVNEKFTGARLDLEYNDRGLLTKVSDPMDRQVSLDYDDEWRLRSIPAPAMKDEAPDRRFQFTYTGRRIIAAHDLLGDPIFSCSYDSLGRVLSQDDGRPDTPPSTFAYSDHGNGTSTTRLTDPAGHGYTFLHDASFHLLCVTNPLGHQVKCTYDANGNRISRTDARGHTTTFTYDPDTGDMTSVTDPAGNQTDFEHVYGHFVSKITDAFVEDNGTRRSTRFGYDDRRMTRVTDDLGNQDRKEYHPDTGKLRRVILADDAEIHFDPNPDGPIAQATHPNDAGGVAPMEVAGYDLAGRLTKSTSRRGYDTFISYSASSDVIARKDPLGNAETFDYDHRGRRVRMVDKRGYATRYTYDGNNNVRTITDALGGVTAYTYDVLDRVTRVTDPLGNSVRYRYDAIGRRVAVTDAIGRTTRTDYDAAGNVTAQYDAAGIRVLSFTYDNRDLPIRAEDAYGHAISYTYDAVGRRRTVTDAKGRTTTYHYDRLDRPIGVTDPLGRRSEATYGPDDTLETLKAPGAAAINFSYTASNQLRSFWLANGDETRYLYFASTDQIFRFSASQQRFVEFAYDELDRLLLENIADSAGTQQDLDRRYQYDASGNLTTIETKHVSESVTATSDPYVARHTRTYDAANRLASYTDEFGNTVGYTYDLLGNLRRLTYPDGFEVHYAYDVVNRLTTVTDSRGRVTRYTYDRRDFVTSIEMPNGTRRMLSYDSGGRLLKREDLDVQGALIVAYHYAYDAEGQVQSEHVQPDDAPLVVEAHDFGYNSVNQLVSFDGESLTYDREGNLTRGPSGSGLATLFYNARGRLKGTSGIAFDYDEEDRLNGWGSTRLVLNPGATMSQVLTKREEDGTLTRYIYGIGLIYEEIDGETLTHHYDHRGSTVALSGDVGTTVGRISYDPYGKITNRSGQTDSIFLFNGLYGVITTPNDLNYMRFRWYWPEAGRFITADAHLGNVGVLASLNRYAFAAGNPVSQLDPRGEFVHVLVGGLIGAAVNITVEIVSSAISNQPLDFNRIAGSAAGGFVTGALIAGTGGAAASLGAVAFAGAVGGATTNLVRTGLNGESVDLLQLGLETAIGAGASVGGKLGGDAFGKFGDKMFKRFGQNSGWVGKATRKLFTPDKITRRKGFADFQKFVSEQIAAENKSIAIKALVSVGFGVGFKQAKRGIFPSTSDTTGGIIVPSPGGQGDPSNTGGGVGAIYRQALHEVNVDRPQTYGEYAHYAIFLQALSLADRPVPNNPSNTLTGF